MRVELIKTNASDESVARAAWVSNYGEDAREKEAGRIAGLINYLYRNLHMSPFEHGSFTFFIDVPIFVAREFMRHRTFSFNEVSGRYTELKPKFYVPANHRPLVQQGKVGEYTFVPGTDEQYAKITRWHEQNFAEAWDIYQAAINNGVAREVARNVLPVSTYTQFYATTNLRNLMHFLELRNAENALFEIRDVAEQMEEIFELTTPLTWSAFDKKRTMDGVLKELAEKYSLEELERLAKGLIGLTEGQNSPSDALADNAGVITSGQFLEA